LKEGIGLRGYGQKDPPSLNSKKEAFILFEDMMTRIDNETVRYLFHIQVQQGEQPPSGSAPQAPSPQQLPRPRADAAAASAAARARRAAAFACGGAGESNAGQQRQQKDLQYQTGPATGEAPKPVKSAQKFGRNRSLPVRLREEVQEMPRALALGQTLFSCA